jgi:hypothetical protein
MAGTKQGSKAATVQGKGLLIIFTRRSMEMRNITKRIAFKYRSSLLVPFDHWKA